MEHLDLLPVDGLLEVAVVVCSVPEQVAQAEELVLLEVFLFPILLMDKPQQLALVVAVREVVLEQVPRPTHQVGKEGVVLVLFVI